jgi:hypothetical protein
MRPAFLLALSLPILFFFACGEDAPSEKVAPGATPAAAPAAEGTRALAEEAYLFAYPMLENYKTLYATAIAVEAPSFRTPLNAFHHDRQLLGPEFTEVVRPNRDTLYSFLWLDLRAEPIVLSVPPIEGERYYSFQLVDLYTHNLGYIGARATGFEGGSYLIAGPGWKGEKPWDVDAVLQSEGNLVFVLARTGVAGAHDVEHVHRIQDQFDAEPLSEFLGEEPPEARPALEFPPYDQQKATSADFIGYLSFLLGQVEVDPSEVAMVERWKAIGVEPGGGFPTGLSGSERAEIELGIADARRRIEAATAKLGTLENGWMLAAEAFGNRAAMQGRYETRAAAAMFGLYGNDLEEAFYPGASVDGEGEPLDGSKHAYTLTFSAEQLPPVRGFWSMTMYALPSQLMVANPKGRYAIGDRTEELAYDDDSLTIFIQKDSPGEERESNWLPAPDGPFSVQLRMYLPESSALDPLYVPPPLVRAE